MSTLASTIHEMVGDLRDDLQRIVSSRGLDDTIVTASARLQSIRSMTNDSQGMVRATKAVAVAIDRALPRLAEARAQGPLHDEEAVGSAVRLLEAAIREMRTAANALP